MPKPNLRAVNKEKLEAVATAAIEYVEYFFPPTETGRNMGPHPTGDLVRAVRVIQEKAKGLSDGQSTSGEPANTKTI